MAKQRSPNEGKNEVWLKCESKRKPGCFYIFNPTTGERSWCATGANRGRDQNVAQARLPMPQSVSSFLKTPAQDRLNRYQNCLIADAAKNTVKAGPGPTAQRKETSNNTLCLNPNKSTSELNTNKRAYASIEGNCGNKSMNFNKNKRSRNAIYNPTENVENETAKRFPTTASTNQTPKPIENTANTAISSKNTTSTPFKTVSQVHWGSVERGNIKKKNRGRKQTAVSKRNSLQLKDSAKTNILDNLPELTNTNSAVVSLKNVKAESNTPALPQIGPEPIEKELQTGFTENILPKHNIYNGPIVTGLDMKDSPTLAQFRNPFRQSKYVTKSCSSNSDTYTSTSPQSSSAFSPSFSTTHPNKLNYTGSQLNCANERSDIFKQEFEKDIKENNISPTDIKPHSPVYDSLSYNNSYDVEPMDWQSCDETETNITKTEGNNSLTMYSYISTSSSNGYQMSESDNKFTKVLNENLMSMSNAFQKKIANIDIALDSDYFYIVLDTNVVLQQINYIKNLYNINLNNITGSIVYIPYCVVNELDKLKINGLGSVRSLAMRAIKSLNVEIEKHDKHVQAQSAEEECQHIIQVRSNDDSIINCCLQLKRKRKKYILLLTEDINLRTKASCNNIMSSTWANLFTRNV